MGLIFHDFGQNVFNVPDSWIFILPEVFNSYLTPILQGEDTPPRRSPSPQLIAETSDLVPDVASLHSADQSGDESDEDGGTLLHPKHNKQKYGRLAFKIFVLCSFFFHSSTSPNNKQKFVLIMYVTNISFEWFSSLFFPTCFIMGFLSTTWYVFVFL